MLDRALLLRYVGDVKQLHPHEIHRAAYLWSSPGGEPWLVAFAFAEIADRIECVGMEMRSYIASEEARKGSVQAYQSYWTGGVSTPFRQVRVDEVATLLLRLGSDVSHPVAPYDPLALEAGAHREKGMLTPHPLRAATLRELPFARLLSEVRAQIAERKPKLGLPGIAERLEFERRAAQPDAEAVGVLEAWLAADHELREAFRTGKRRPGHPAAYSDAHLEMVADLYRDAFSQGSSSPTKDVATALGVTRNVAAKLVMRCRRARLLGQTEQRKAGATRPRDENAES